MNKLYFLILVGLSGYIAYPYVPPKLLGISEKKRESQPVPQAEPAEVAEKPVVISKDPSEENDARPKKLGSHSMGKKKDLPEIEEEPEDLPLVKELDASDISRIITKRVEEGKLIDFRKDNIISWELKEQAFSLMENRYKGEVSIEVGTLFGPELRRANVEITDEEISSWKWVEVDKNK